MSVPEHDYANVCRQRDRLVVALREVEWCLPVRTDFGHNDYSTVMCCPHCLAPNPDQKWALSGSSEPGHEKGCAIASALREVES